MQCSCVCACLGHLAIRVMFDGFADNISHGEYSSANMSFSLRTAVLSQKFKFLTIVFKNNTLGLVSVLLNGSRNGTSVAVSIFYDHVVINIIF